jgi:Rhomboid family
MYAYTICMCSCCQPVGCADEYHLFYNMSSFLWKGVQLEPAMGAARYALLLAELWLVSGALLCALFAAGASMPSSVPFAAYYYHSYCAVGFSAVLFGLKTILYSSNDRWQEVHLPFIGRVSTPPRVRPAVAQSSQRMSIEFKQKRLVEHDKHVTGCIVLCARPACAGRAALRCDACSPAARVLADHGMGRVVSGPARDAQRVPHRPPCGRLGRCVSLFSLFYFRSCTPCIGGVTRTAGTGFMEQVALRQLTEC